MMTFQLPYRPLNLQLTHLALRAILYAMLVDSSVIGHITTSFFLSQTFNLLFAVPLKHQKYSNA